jgi:hypothetical protein
MTFEAGEPVGESADRPVSSVGRIWDLGPAECCVRSDKARRRIQYPHSMCSVTVRLCCVRLCRVALVARGLGPGGWDVRWDVSRAVLESAVGRRVTVRLRDACGV